MYLLSPDLLRSSFSDLGKEFVAEPQDLTLHLGDTAMLECLIEGAPTPSVRWYLEDREIRETPDNINLILHKGGLLEISRIKFADFGRYKCVVENVDGSRTSRYATISKNHDSGRFFLKNPEKAYFTSNVRRGYQMSVSVSVFATLIFGEKRH